AGGCVGLGAGADGTRRQRARGAAWHNMERTQSGHDAALERRTVHRDTVRATDATREGRGGPFMIGMGSVLVFVALAILVLIIIAKTAVVVPQQNAYVVERLGRYSGTLGAGFHILMPFLDVIRYRHSLKEAAYDIPAQV